MYHDIVFIACVFKVGPTVNMCVEGYKVSRTWNESGVIKYGDNATFVICKIIRLSLD